MILTYILVGLGLLLLNATLVYFIRNPQTFAFYPGIVFMVLFLCFGGYLVHMVSTLTPEVAAISRSGTKPVKGQAASKELSASKLTVMEEEKKYKSREGVQTITIYLNIMIIQALIALIAAIIGSKMVPFRKSYYYGFLALYMILIVIMSSAEYLVIVRTAV